ncbi:MAG: ABC transporter permease [Anaerolineae bacterium]|nr:ABC transporter permease [Anaerolineae bacterium]
MRRLTFYLHYAFSNLRRSGQWTAFAVLCVAAGVATVVALRSLGLTIGDSLLTNLREINRGDITVRSIGGGPFNFTVNQGENERSIFSDRDVQRIGEIVARYGGEMSAYSQYGNVQISALDYQTLGRPQFVSTLFIDPQTFPPVGEIIAIDPPDTPLSALFTGGYEVVIGQNLADEQGLAVGDEVHVTGTDQLFTVRGIVPTNVEANINNLTALFFGFVYIDTDIMSALQLNPAPNHISIVLPVGTDTDTIEQLGTDLWQAGIRGIHSIQTTPGLLEANEEIGDLIGRFIVVLGLGALLIGGVGIVNTMLVMVGRRTMEIASLKTFGLKGRQIAMLFISEAFLLGLAGSIIGVVLGLGLSLVVNRFGEILLLQPLAWRLHPEAIWYGLGLGMVVTMVFGVLPVLVASRVRPAIVLRPNQTHIASSSALQVLIALAIIVVTLGFITGQIIEPLLVRALHERAPSAFLSGMVIVAVMLVILLLLAGFMWMVVWLVSRFPSFGNTDLRLALRNMTARRTRTATTLLALSAGMFALSSISYFGLSARQIVQFQFSDTLGGNVMVIPLLRSGLPQTIFNQLLAQNDDIIHDTKMSLLSVWLRTVDGQPVQVGDNPIGVRIPAVIRETDNPELRSGVLVAGRDLSPDDVGKNVVVLSEQSLLETAVREFTLDDLGVHVGSMVRVQVGGYHYDLEVVGIVSSLNGIIPNFGGAFVPPGVIQQSLLTLNVLEVKPDRVDAFLNGISRFPFALALDVTFVDSLLLRLIEQMSAIPTLVGLLSLLAAAVIMANTVSLATLERRQQIGILKTIGLRRGRVLRVMLLENTVIGLLGALLGIAISAIGVSIMTTLGMGIPIPIPQEAIPVTVALVLAAVFIAWLATFLSARVAVNERVTQVLRYE